MKSKVKQILLVVIIFMLCLIPGIAQDTVEVPVLDPNNDEFLNKYIDNNSGNVYELQRDKTYHINAPITSSKGLKLVGKEGSKDVTPAKIRAGYKSDGSLADPTFDITGDFTLKNIYVIGRGVSNEIMQNCIGDLKGDSTDIYIDNCIIEGNKQDGVRINGEYCNLTVTNSIFRNNLSINYSYNGRCIYFHGVGNKVVMKNNTFFNNVAYVAVLRTTKKFIFDHNTVVNQMTEVFWTPHIANARVKNNIFYNPEFIGQLERKYIWRNPDSESAGVICLDTLSAEADSIYKNHLLGDGYERKVEVQSNAYYWQQQFKDFWATADSLIPASFIDKNTMKFFNDNDNYPAMIAENNVKQDPGFAKIGNNLDEMIQQSEAIRGETENTYWGLPTNREVVWPLPEDFSYLADLIGTDGKALGDLNWQDGSYYNNTTPVPSFTVSPDSGGTATVFEFDASGCSDKEDDVSDLQVRWDWENDGTWDTDFTTTKTTTHQYYSKGIYTVKLQVRDTSGAKSTTTQTIEVGMIPEEGTQKWAYNIGSTVYSNPAIGLDGTIYVGSGDRFAENTDSTLYALNPDGTKRWEFKTGGRVLSSPTIDSKGTIYIGSHDNNLYAINPDGTIKWAFETTDNVESSPAIGSSGTIYVVSEDYQLYAINPDGTKKWVFETGAGSPVIDSDGTIYIGSYGNKLYAINPDGTKKWEFETADYVKSSPAIGSDGTIYVGSADSTLYAINPDGTIKWGFEATDHLLQSPSIGPNGIIYLVSGDTKLYAINPDGTERWSKKATWSAFSTPAIDSDGTIYMGSFNNNLCALNPNGTIKWRFDTEGRIISSPAIGLDGTIYISSKDNNIYAINGDSDGLADTPWPMFQKNVRHTGRFEKDLKNDPPSASFTVSPDTGYLATDFGFDASNCSDNEDYASALQVRWDWQNDGTWDTDYTTDTDTSHQFTSRGEYSVKLEVKDTEGATDTKTKTVLVDSSNAGPIVMETSPNKFGLWRDSIIISFDREINITDNSAFNVNNSQNKNIDVYSSKSRERNKLYLIPKKHLPPQDSIRIELTTDITDKYGRPLDGDNDGRKDGAPEDNYSWTFSTPIIADYNGDKSIDAADLSLFTRAWKEPQNPSYDIGPTQGEPPFTEFNPDSTINFKDFVTLTRMWNWALKEADLNTLFNNRLAKKTSNKSQEKSLPFLLKYKNLQKKEKKQLVLAPQIDNVKWNGEQDNSFNIDILTQAKSKAVNLIIKSSSDGISYKGISSPKSVLNKRSIRQNEISQNILETNNRNKLLTYNRNNFTVIDLVNQSLNISNKLLSLNYNVNRPQKCNIEYYYTIYGESGEIITQNSSSVEINTKLLIPKTYKIYQNYPNPFNSSTILKYQLPRQSSIRLDIFNLLGQKVVTLVHDDRQPGYYKEKWQGRNQKGELVSSGTYIYRIIAHSKNNTFTETKKILYLK